MSAAEAARNDFEALFRTYYSRLARLLYRVTGDAARAEEIAAEAFWRLYRRPPRSNDNVEGWLYRTGVRLALDRLKQERRRARYEALAAVFRSVPGPYKAVEDRERATRVRRALAALKPKNVLLIVLRSEGLSYGELAAALRLNPGSVGTLLARAEEAFRKEYLNRYGQQ